MAAARGGLRFGLRCDSSLHGAARDPFARRSLGLRGLSRQAARRRDLQHGGYRPVGLFAVLPAERVVPRPPARAGGRAEDVELPKPVRHDGRPDRQPYPRHARPSASLAPAARLRPNPGDAAPARWAARLPTARWPCADRARWHGILLLAKARLSAVPDPPACQRQDRELPCPAGGHGRGARPRHGLAHDAGVHRAPGRRGEAGLRTQRRQALAGRPCQAPDGSAAHLPRRRPVRVPADGGRDHRGRRGLPPHGHDAMLVSWIGVSITDAKGHVTYRSAFVTSLPVTRDTVAEIVACARARWKIENEGFNVLKCNGYHLEHNFGHGKQNLAMMFAAMNLLAFALHTVCDCLEQLWTEARTAKRARTRFFEHIRTITAHLVFADWATLMQTLIDSKPPPHVEAQLAR